MSGDEIVPLLREENLEPPSNVCQQRTIKPQRGLPPGKTYHIFISYSSHDQPYVLRLKNVLEGLGFKCMLAEHDFSYGVSVMRNIETTIQTCHKLLLVVSQHFLQSAMCDKEVDMAHKYAADIGRNDFMLVLRLDDSKMPLKLDYMTYIKGAELEVKDVGRKVEKAFAGFADVPLRQNINGQEILRKQPTSKSRRQCCSSSYELSDLSQFERNTLVSWSVEMMKRLHSIVRKNTDCKSQNYIVIPRRHRNTIFISFIYYDMKPCWNYLVQRAREYWPDDSEENIANKCNEELVTTILDSFKGSDWNPIPQAVSIRHNTYQNRCCLCLVAQSSWTYRKSALNVIPEQSMENNQNEETCVMKIAESEKEHETFVKKTFEIDNKYFESPEENDETTVMKLLNNRKENISFDSHGAEVVSGSPLTEAASGFRLTEAEGGTYLRGAEGGTSLRGAVGGTSLIDAVSGSLLDSNIDRWYGNMCETRVREEATSTQQPQVSKELITWGKHPANLTDSEMSTSLNDRDEAVTLQSEDEELQWFRGEHVIDEATHAKVPR